MRDYESERLAERIFGAVPVSQLAFMKLLSLLEVSASREVPSAAVTVGARSRLLVNPDFVAQRCHTDRALMMLVMHELYHVLLGHTRLFPRVTPAQNLVFDAIINAHLCRLFPDPESTALFRQQYDSERFPEALLRPPAGWRTPQERWSLPPAAAAAHRALYQDDTATQSELFALLEASVDALSAGGGGGGATGLLGNHGEQEEGFDPDFIEAVREILARWPAAAIRSGRDRGVTPYTALVEPAAARREAVSTLRRALRHVALGSAGLRGRPRWDSRPGPTLLPYRRGVDRRAEARAALGWPTLLYQAATELPALVHDERTHLYLDVSGSMTPFLAVLYGALLPLRGFLHEQVHLFSTYVADLPFEKLRRGVVVSDGGTDIHCVTEHMVAHEVRSAAILTDGIVGYVPHAHLVHLRKRKTRLSAILTPQHEERFALTLGAQVFVLPNLMQGHCFRPPERGAVTMSLPRQRRGIFGGVRNGRSPECRLSRVSALENRLLTEVSLGGA